MCIEEGPDLAVSKLGLLFAKATTADAVFVLAILLCKVFNCSAGAQGNCSTVAYDRQDGDISGSIVVQPAASCQAEQNVACANCPIAQLQIGNCIPDK